MRANIVTTTSAILVAQFLFISCSFSAYTIAQHVNIMHTNKHASLTKFEQFSVLSCIKRFVGWKMRSSCVIIDSG